MVLAGLKRLIWGQVVHAMGDSHAEVFSYVDFNKILGNNNFSSCIVQGATASGLKNPHSKTKAAPIFLNYLRKKVDKNDYVFFQLGEVDCGFVIWIRAEKYGISIQQQKDLMVNNYILLLEEFRNKVGNKLVISSIIPPTIKDGQLFGNVSNLRSQLRATQIERTRLTQLVNSHLKDYCLDHDVLYLDLDDTLIDSATGLVREYYLNDNKEDHHLNNVKLASLVEMKLGYLV